MAELTYDPETGEMIDKYDLYFKKKAAKEALNKEVASGGVVDKSGGMPESDFTAPTKSTSSAYGDSAMAAGKSAAGGESVEDIAAAGLLAAPNPYAKAAGLGLMTLSSINKQKQQNQLNKYNAEVQRIKARQDAINRMAQIGQGLRL